MYKKSLTYLKFDPTYKEEPEAGHFAPAIIQKKGVRRSEEWEHCRESFDSFFPRGRYFLFYVDKKGENVARFIAEAERRLKIEPKSEILGFTNVSNVCCVGMSKWWRANAGRRQLFTILLRCGLSFKKNFEQALYSEEYAENTKEAIERFFQGYTHCTRRMKGEAGWVSYFDREESIYEIDGWMDEEEEKETEKNWQKYLAKSLQKPKK